MKDGFGRRPAEVDEAMRAKSLTPEARAKARATAATKKEIKEIIRLVMGSPITNKEMNYVDGKLSLEHFKGKNTDAQTRIIIQMTLNALRGNRDAAEFLMKYGGYEPPREQNITIDRPTIIDDFTEAADTLDQPAKKIAVTEDRTADDAEIASMIAADPDEEK